MAQVIIIIPTYNEVESTSKMIPALAKIIPTIKSHKIEVLYVDGNSPDGTPDVIRKHQIKYKWLHLLVEAKKGGLGAAYASGMKYAMKELGADWLLEFDADFQHPVEDIPRLIAEIDHGCDYVIGSRYVPGGSIPASWGFNRKFLSVVGNLVARVCLVLPHIHDVTTGFKLSRVRGFMDQFDFTTLLSKSFAYKIHLLFYMVQKGAKVKEVPFHFATRDTGESKIIKNEMQETLRVIFLLQLNNPKFKRFFKFGIVGLVGLIVQTAIFEIVGLRLKLLSPTWASVVGGEMAIISNFTWNNLWTFKDYAISGIKVLSKFIQFNLTSLLALGIQFIIMAIGEVIAAGNLWILRIFFFAAIIIVIFTNYFIYNRFIWRTSRMGSSRK
jgi:dolichol-phosphate mannosyltransferase